MKDKEIIEDKPKDNEYSIRLYGDIGEVDENIITLIETLDKAEVNDVINIYINTAGGNIDTTISIIHAINRTKANTIAYADGPVISAGTFIFLACKEKIVQPYSYFMFHSAIVGLPEMKMQDGIKSIECLNQLTWAMAVDFYSQIFTVEEIKEIIIDGKDRYLNADEMIDKLLNKNKR